VDWYDSGFPELDSAQQIEILSGVEKESAEFFNTLIVHTYNGCYTNKEVLEVCGASTVPPQTDGYVVEVGSLSSLDSVMTRGKFYKDV
jgi:hypothetical protein